MASSIPVFCSRPLQNHNSSSSSSLASTPDFDYRSSDGRSLDESQTKTLSPSMPTSRSLPDLLVSLTAQLRIQSNPLKDDENEDGEGAEDVDDIFVDDQLDQNHYAHHLPLNGFSPIRWQTPQIKAGLVKLGRRALPQLFSPKSTVSSIVEQPAKIKETDPKSGAAATLVSTAEGNSVKTSLANGNGEQEHGQPCHDDHSSNRPFHSGPTFGHESNHWINGVFSCLRPFIGSLGKLQHMGDLFGMFSAHDGGVGSFYSSNRPASSDEKKRTDWEIPPEDIHDLSWIRSGAEGAVYLGMYNNQRVAVKKIREHSGRELQHLRRLRHPNVIRLIGVCSHPPNCCIVMEYCENGSLYDFLKHPELVSLQRVCDWSRQVCDGMLYLHQNRIIHRDLKSPNVLLTESFTLKITDFGASRTNSHESVQMSYMGTFAWMAPEVIRNKKCNEKVDVWSYGVLLWELLTCQVPYDQCEWMCVLVGVGNNNLRLPIPDACSSAFRSLIQRCWNTRPRGRPSFAQLAFDLQPALVELQCVLADVDLIESRHHWRTEVSRKLAIRQTGRNHHHHRLTTTQMTAGNIEGHDKVQRASQRSSRTSLRTSLLFVELQQRERRLHKREQELGLQGAKSPVHKPYATHNKSNTKTRCQPERVDSQTQTDIVGLDPIVADLWATAAATTTTEPYNKNDSMMTASMELPRHCRCGQRSDLVVVNSHRIKRLEHHLGHTACTCSHLFRPSSVCLSAVPLLSSSPHRHPVRNVRVKGCRLVAKVKKKADNIENVID